MEKEFAIKTSNNKYKIYGVLNYSTPKPQNLVIFVHGLTGHKNEHHFYNAIKRFNQEGFATCRFDFYGGGKDSRELKNSTVTMHAQDLNAVVNEFKKKFKKIFLVGHSLGGPTILLSDTSQVDGIVLWDPSSGLNSKRFLSILSLCKWHNKFHAYTLKWGVEYIVGKKMVEEWKHFPDCGELVKKIHVPIKFIFAGNNWLAKHGFTQYTKSANEPKASYVVSGAGHCFDEEGTEEVLHRETIDWFKKYVR